MMFRKVTITNRKATMIFGIQIHLHQQRLREDLLTDPKNKIDRMVYKLYGLTDEEIAVVERQNKTIDL